jgi:hypothetical protein
VGLMKRRHAEMSAKIPSLPAKRRMFLFWDIENLRIPKRHSAFQAVSALKNCLMSVGVLAPGVSTYMECFHNPRGAGALTRVQCRDLVRAGSGLIDTGIQVRPSLNDKCVDVSGMYWSRHALPHSLCVFFLCILFVRSLCAFPLCVRVPPSSMIVLLASSACPPPISHCNSNAPILPFP